MRKLPVQAGSFLDAALVRAWLLGSFGRSFATIPLCTHRTAPVQASRRQCMDTLDVERDQRSWSGCQLSGGQSARKGEDSCLRHAQLDSHRGGQLNTSTWKMRWHGL